MRCILVEGLLAKWNIECASYVRFHQISTTSPACLTRPPSNLTTPRRPPTLSWECPLSLLCKAFSILRLQLSVSGNLSVPNPGKLLQKPCCCHENFLYQKESSFICNIFLAIFCWAFIFNDTAFNVSIVRFPERVDCRVSWPHVSRYRSKQTPVVVLSLAPPCFQR